MPYKIKFEASRKLVTVVASTCASPDARLESLRAVRTDARFRGDYRILCNFLDAQYVRSSAERFSLGLLVIALFRGQQIAIVVRHAELKKLRELVATMQTARVDINVFDNMKAAQSWLLPPPRADAGRVLASTPAAAP